jgi:hypothetical protein
MTMTEGQYRDLNQSVSKRTVNRAVRQLNRYIERKHMERKAPKRCHVPGCRMCARRVGVLWYGEGDLNELALLSIAEANEITLSVTLTYYIPSMFGKPSVNWVTICILPRQDEAVLYDWSP